MSDERITDLILQRLERIEGIEREVGTLNDKVWRGTVARVGYHTDSQARLRREGEKPTRRGEARTGRSPRRKGSVARRGQGARAQAKGLAGRPKGRRGKARQEQGKAGKEGEVKGFSAPTEWSAAGSRRLPPGERGECTS